MTRTDAEKAPDTASNLQRDCINCNGNHVFVGFSARGHELHSDQTVYSRMLHWSESWGSMIYAKYGVYRVNEGKSQTLHICKARKDYKCKDCGQRIDKGQYHASATYYDHYCLGCVETVRPATESTIPAVAKEQKL